MKTVCLLILLYCLSGCRLKTSTSVSGDADLFSTSGVVLDTSVPSAARFSAVRGIIKARCASCHSSFLSYSEQKWVSYLYVVPGSATDSTLFKKLAGAVSGSGGNMPLGDTLSSSDISAFQTWINGMGSPSSFSSDDGTASASTRTAAALSVIATSCSSCHQVSRTATSSVYSGTTVPAFANSALFAADTDFVVAGLVSPGNPTSSWIYRALQSYGDIGTMPSGSSALTSSQRQTFVDWINGMGQP